ncbi:tryptophan-rich sensory protein [Mobilitalea sibirica]|uniref:Tryptophan-rich sensory protein n=1 Tax=Mobilitalea sibirica TaxID=1462919 RepID=A0A8J7H1I2_9FIRM|nr:tryptophan-rich sensory protein [Mobilitalea sibirica]MBH1940258.1 tryptophan-rich sensory protein [Mobilitalea sibirica]
MVKKINNILIPIVVLITYIIMVITNSLANALPINGKGTGEISDSYQNLFAPAGITFAIWGLIYLLLLMYSINQLINYKRESDIKQQIFNAVGVLFSVSSVANTIWIFAWHYNVIWLSVILMLVILICLIKINIILKDKDFSVIEKFTVKLPFTVYFGWITIATIANVTTFLVSVNWNRLSLSEVFWTNLIIIIGAVIGFICVLFYKSLAYGCVFIWAYMGIALKHLSPETFDGRYPSVIITVFIAILLIILSQVILIRVRVKDKKIG